MIGALWTGISGLASQQKALDNESNNIANVNTIGYKASRVSFADLMYQDSIGKGSSVTKAEKQYTQGSLNLTGSSYDVALNGDGFFVVSNKNSTGSSEQFYTRAGNFRMGDNGTLQDASGNEVQGWALANIDTTSDVVSTNSNLSSFTDIFTQIAGNQIVQFSNKIETYAAKMSDYSTSSKTDSSVLTGSGIKTQSAKNSDIEALITNYSSALSAYATNTDALSSTSMAQTTVIDFPSGTKSALDSDSDQIYVYVNTNGDNSYDGLYLDGDSNNTPLSITKNSDGSYKVTNSTTSTLESKHSVFDYLDEITNALKQQDSNGNAITEDEATTILSKALDKFESAYDTMDTTHAKLGTRTATIDNYENIVQTKLTNFNLLQENYSSADLTTLAIESQSLQNTYTALYSTINKINNLSLVNYLR